MTSELRDLVTGAVEAGGFEVIQFKNHPRHVVRVWIDREPDGPTVADCVSLTRSLRAAFSAEDLDPGDYEIEVLSPGLDRPLSRAKDFERFQGQQVHVRLKEKQDGRWNFKGKLLGLEEGVLAVEGGEGAPWRFQRRYVAEVRLVPDLPAPKHEPGERTRKPRKARRKRPKEH